MNEIEDTGNKEGRTSPEKISVLEIINEKIIPIIGRYQEILDSDVQLILPDRLGEVSQNDLKRNKENLGALRELLEEFAKNPGGFELVVKSESHEDGARYLLKLRSPGDPKELPTEESKALRQLSFFVVLENIYETREERIKRESLGRSAEEALIRTQEKVLPEISITISTHSVYRDEKIGRIRVNFNPGIVVSFSSQEGVRSQGIVFVGATPHYTNYLPEKNLTPEEVKILKEFLIGLAKFD